MENTSIVRQVWEHLEPEISESGYELIEVEFGQFGSGYSLRLFIDHKDGITLDDCTAVSRLISALLDQNDFIDMHYNLEVSSPGLDRPIRKPEDFERFAGEKVKLKTIAPVEGRKRFAGVLTGFKDGLITFEQDGKDVGIHIENLKKAQLDR